MIKMMNIDELKRFDEKVADVVKPGTYRGTTSGTHYYNSKTNNWVFVDDHSKFQAGWNLYPSQKSNLMKFGDVT
jgi:hypothetical protein